MEKRKISKKLETSIGDIVKESSFALQSICPYPDKEYVQENVYDRIIQLLDVQKECVTDQFVIGTNKSIASFVIESTKDEGISPDEKDIYQISITLTLKTFEQNSIKTTAEYVWLLKRSGQCTTISNSEIFNSEIFEKPQSQEQPNIPLQK